MNTASAACSSMRLEVAGDEKPHVLAVDDSFVDRKIIEKLLTSSACKGTDSIHIVIFLVSFPFKTTIYFFSFFLFWIKCFTLAADLVLENLRQKKTAI